MTTTSAIERGRDAIARRAWAEAFDALSAARHDGGLGLDDLERLVVASHMLAREDDSLELLAEAHRTAMRTGDVRRAVRSAFWLFVVLQQRGDNAQAGGWKRRAERLLADQELCVEHGYLLLTSALDQLASGEFAAADVSLAEVGSIAERFEDPDLGTLARLCRGEALLGLGETATGIALLDEAMLAVTADEVSPAVVGIVYCTVIEACHRVFDLRRAQEWTAALDRWLQAQPEAVAYRGQCLLHRAELMTLHGAWPEAVEEAIRAHARLADVPGEAGAGAAVYQQAELYRLRGEYELAEQAYRVAGLEGRQPQPGLAMLRLAQGRLVAADAAIRLALDEPADPGRRPRLLEARVEIALERGDLDDAEASAAELVEIAERSDAPLLAAMAARAEGAVRLARNDPRAALGALRKALTTWQALDVPYEAARARVLIAHASRALGDEDAAAMELEAARRVFRRLGAVPDLVGTETLVRSAAAPVPGGLTNREVEVLRLVAAGKTNRAIATELVISEKTVARHLSNIFAKLDLSSRSAATAYAYEHRLVTSST
jgi:DNA-binding NarL/FixJ family response regulator